MTKMVPYIVAGLFDTGALCVTGVIAPSSEAATAAAAVRFTRSIVAFADLTGLCVQPLEIDFLRSALRALEGEPVEGRVISLVQPGDNAAGPTMEELRNHNARMAQNLAPQLYGEIPTLGGMGSRDDEPAA